MFDYAKKKSAFNTGIEMWAFHMQVFERGAGFVAAHTQSSGSLWVAGCSAKKLLFSICPQSPKKTQVISYHTVLTQKIIVLGGVLRIQTSRGPVTCVEVFVHVHSALVLWTVRTEKCC